MISKKLFQSTCHLMIFTCTCNRRLFSTTGFCLIFGTLFYIKHQTKSKSSPTSTRMFILEIQKRASFLWCGLRSDQNTLLKCTWNFNRLVRTIYILESYRNLFIAHISHRIVRSKCRLRFTRSSGCCFDFDNFDASKTAPTWNCNKLFLAIKE